MVSSPGPSNNNHRIPETDPRDPETEIGSLETELRVRRIHDTLGTRITEDASQPGGPSQEGAGRYGEASVVSYCLAGENRA